MSTSSATGIVVAEIHAEREQPPGGHTTSRQPSATAAAAWLPPEGTSIVPKPFVPSPGDWGWEKCDGEWEVVWTTLPEAAKACYELFSCKCKKTCKGNCKCHRANLQCTSLCACDGKCYGN